MKKISRGAIHWSDINPIRGREPAQRRPLLILSDEVFNRRSGTVIAMSITSQPQAAGFPLAMKNEDVELPKDAWIKLGQIRTLSVDRLGRRIGQVKPETMARVLEGLNELLGA